MALDLNTEIMSVIRGQLLALVNNDTIYSAYNVGVYDEQTYGALQGNIRFKKNDIYIIVHFFNGTIYAESITVPLYFEIISEENSLVVAKNLMIEYGITYNFATPQTGLLSTGVYVQQAYTTPQTQSNFNEVSGGYRSLLVLNATFVVGENISAITNLEIDGASINFISADATCTMTPNTIDTGVNNGRTQTKNKFATFALTLTLVSKSSAFINKLDSIAFGTANINTTFYVSFVKNGLTYTKTLHMLAPDFKQTKGTIPTYTVSLIE